MKRFCTQCGSPATADKKFCTSCGTPIQRLTERHHFCQCGKEYHFEKQFCPACGTKNPESTSPEKQVVPVQKSIFCTGCGTETGPDKKFCPKCGKQLKETVVLQNDIAHQEHVKKQIPQTRRKSSKKIVLIAVASVILIAAGAVYFTQFYKPPVKKVLLASFSVLPNDTTETIIQHNNELTLIIPKGQIKQADTLDLYAVKNLEKPEFTDKVIKTFDFDFRKTNSFDDEVEVIFSYQQEQQRNEFKPGHVPYIMYYNEQTSQWEDTDVIIDKKNNTVRVYRSHFSSLGMVSATTEPGPMMKVLAMVDPSTILTPPDFSEAEKLIRYYIAHKTAPADAEIDGIDLFMKSYEITTLSSGVHEDILKYPTFSTLNKVAGKLGLLKAFVSFGIETGRKQYLDAVINLSKELLTYGLAAAGWKVVAVYSVANFLYGLHQEHKTELDEAALQQDYLNKYYKYNANQNPYSKSVKGWSMFIQENIETHVDFDWALSQEINNYLTAYFNEYQVPENIRENIIKHERNRMNDVIISAFDDYRIELRKQQEFEIIRDLSEMKNQMNTVLQIRVNVYGSKAESKAVRNLPVRIVVGKDQHLWEGTTDKAGQWWFNCTRLGYLHYGAPTMAEIEYKGQTLQKQFVFEEAGSVDVRFYVDTDEDQQPDQQIDEPVTTIQPPKDTLTKEGKAFLMLGCIMGVALATEGYEFDVVGLCECAIEYSGESFDPSKTAGWSEKCKELGEQYEKIVREKGIIGDSPGN
jgi:hypothetical protein